MGNGMAVGNWSSQSVKQYAVALPWASLTGVNVQHQVLGIPRLGTSPSQASSFIEYTTDSRIEAIFPWVVVDNEQQWNALSVTAVHQFVNPLEAALTDAGDWIRVSYGTNFNSSFNTLGTVGGKTDSNGRTTFQLNNGDGVPFSAFRLKIEMETGNQTRTPDLNQISFSFRKNLDPLWGFTVVIDGEDQGFGRSSKETRETLKALFDKKTLFNFSFKGDAGEEESYKVTAIGFRSIEGTGADQSGQFILRLAEVN